MVKESIDRFYPFISAENELPGALLLQTLDSLKVVGAKHRLLLKMLIAHSEDDVASWDHCI